MKHYKVFIIDDDADDRKMMLEAFSENQPNPILRFFENGETFINVFQEQHPSLQPDLVLLDLNMPGMLGMQVLKELKSMPGGAGVPVIILTTSTLERDKTLAYTLGASCFIRKPSSYTSLLATINAIQQLWLPGH